MKTEMITKENKKEIFYNIINSLLAGALVFFGSLTTGQGFTLAGVLASLGASGVVALTKFKNYWDGEKREYSQNIAVFI